MYGYVFLAKNLVTGRTWVGSNRAVTFDKKYFGDDDKVIDEINKYGISKFSVDMLAPAETEEALVALLAQYKAELEKEVAPVVEEEVEPLSEPVTEKPKVNKGRGKKKIVEDE